MLLTVIVSACDPCACAGRMRLPVTAADKGGGAVNKQSHTARRQDRGKRKKRLVFWELP